MYIDIPCNHKSRLFITQLLHHMCGSDRSPASNSGHVVQFLRDVDWSTTGFTGILKPLVMDNQDLSWLYNCTIHDYAKDGRPEVV